MGLRGIYRRLLVLLNIQERQISFFTKDLLLNNPHYFIGEYTYGKPTVLSYGSASNLFIGKYCSIAENTTIFLGGNHRTDWITTYPFSVLRLDVDHVKTIMGHPATKGNVVIGNDVWLAHSAVIMSGVKIADGAVVGAFSVVTKDIGPYEIWAGNPAKFIRKRFSQEDIDYLINLKWWNMNDEDVNILAPYLCSQSINELKSKVENLKALK